MPISTRDEFIELLEQGEILDGEQLAKARRLTKVLTDIAAVARKLVEANLITRWQANELLRGRQPQKIDNYRLLDLMETQAAGPVFLAKHVSLDRQVVLKALVRQGNSNVPIEALLTEARRLATLDHRNLCHVYDVIIDDDSYYLVVEHVTGQSLREIVDAEGPFPPITAAGLMAMAAGALAHAHELGIRHLGILPERLIIDSNSTLKIVDVGMEQLKTLSHSADTAATTADRAFLAPEQTIAEYPVDERTDIYSLGCVLYYSITGKPPAPVKLEVDLHESPLPSPLQENADQSELPAELAEICSRMMAPLPEARFGSSDEAAGALQSWIQSVSPAQPSVAAEDAEAPMAVVLERGGKRRAVAPKRSRSLQERNIILGVAVGAVLMGIVLAALFWPEESPRPSSDANRARASRIGAREREKDRLNERIPTERPPKSPAVATRETFPPTVAPRVPDDLTSNVVVQPSDSEPPSQPVVSDRTKPPPPDVISITGPAQSSGRYVKVQLLGKNHLSLAEVQVFDTNGMNVALSSAGGIAKESSIYKGTSVASLAIDGNTDGVHAHNSISVTNVEADPWWQVDLGDVKSISRIVVWSRTDCCSDQTSKATVSLLAADGKTVVWSGSTQNMKGNFRRTFELRAAVSLPDVATDVTAATGMEMTVLGKVNYEPSQVTLTLLGGDVASHELGTFQLQPGPTKTQPFRWIATFRPAEGKVASIAEIVLSNQQLSFRWRDESKTIEEANCLRNCLLQIAGGAKTRRIALRTPLGARHLRLGLSNKPEVEAYSIQWLPKGGRLKLELLPDNINLPSNKISTKVLNIESDLAELTFSLPNTLPLVVGIRTYTEDTLLIGALAQWTPPGGKQRVFDRAALVRQRDDLLRRLNVAAAAKRHNEFRSDEQQIANLLSLADQIESAGSLPFRVVMDVDGHEVVVLQSDRDALGEDPQLPAAASDVPSPAPPSPGGGQIPGWLKKSTF